MTTWLEIRQEILGMLDVNAEATTDSEVRNQVDRKLARLRDRIYRQKPPPALFVYTDPLTITSLADYVAILEPTSGDNPGFDLTTAEFLRPLGLVISDDPSTEGEEWDYMEWRGWIRLKNAIAGNQRLSQTFTIDYQGRIHLSQTPATGVEWTAVLHYQKRPDSIPEDGSTEVEIDPGHEGVLIFGVARQFPHFFDGEDRQTAFLSIEKQYQEALKEYLRDRGIAKKDTRFRPAIRTKRPAAINWGTGESS